MSRLTRDGTAEPVSRDQILRHVRGQRNTHFPCPADHKQDWQPYPVDPYSCYMCDHPVSIMYYPLRIILCIMYYVSYIMYYVVSIMYYVVSIMYYVLYYVLIEYCRVG